MPDISIETIDLTRPEIQIEAVGAPGSTATLEVSLPPVTPPVVASVLPPEDLEINVLPVPGPTGATGPRGPGADEVDIPDMVLIFENGLV